MNMTNTTIIDYQLKTYGTSTSSTTKNTKTTDSFRNAIEESVVDKYKRSHPDTARHVEQQVRAGRSVRERFGTPDTAVEDMTMAEYQAYFTAMLDTIPYDSTRVNDTTILTISDKGWEQMKKDPDYEAWVLGYFVEDRAVRNPFFGWGNNDGCMITEHFGASIEEHHGEGISKAALKGDNSDDDDEESWWIKRHKRMQKLMKEQIERNMARDIAQRTALHEAYVKQQHIISQRQHSFLTTGNPDDQTDMMSEGTSPAVASAAYVNFLNLFGSSIIGSNVH